MGRWVDGRWKWKIVWRRELLEREKERVEELLGFSAKFLAGKEWDFLRIEEEIMCRF